MSTYKLRLKLLDIARKDVGKLEDTKNQAPWIRKFWPATTYKEGFNNREPYCAAAGCYWIKEWLKLPEVLKAFKFTPEQADKYRPKSARVFDWEKWAKANGAQVLPKNSILHYGDIVIYSYSHLEIVSNDDNTTTGPFVAIGANTNKSASRDGEGCYEKPRSRSSVKCFIRLLP